MDNNGKSEMELKRTYLKRIKGLQKKAYEFSTLCDVDACMIVYGPKQGGFHRRDQVLPDTFPENPRDVIPIVKRYLSLPEKERTKRHIGLSELSGGGGGGDDAKNKIDQEDTNSDELVNNQRDNNNNNSNADDDGLENWDDRFDKLSADQLQQLIDSVESKIETIDEKIQLIENPSSGVSNLRLVANTPLGISNNSMNMQPLYVLQPFNQNLAANNASTTMEPMGVLNGVTANGANVPYPMIIQYPMMAVRPRTGDNNNQEVYGNHQGQQVAYLVPQAVRPRTGDNNNQEVYGNHQGQQVAYFVPQAVRPRTGDDNNQEVYGNHQGQQVAYFVPQSFVQPMSTPPSFIPNLMPGGTSSDE